MSRFDIVIFGATGYTGKFAVEDLAVSLSKGNTTGITWAVAARNKSKTSKILKDVQNQTGIDLSGITIIEADVNDETSLKNMTRQAKVIANYVGPYLLYGEAVIKACLETKTHHLDISGESLFLEQMQIKYHKKAEEAGIFIIGTCGFDSIPADLGVVMLQDKFPGELSWVEAFAKMNKGPNGFVLNHGTYDSAVALIANLKLLFEIRPVRETLFGTFYRKKTPAYRHRLHRRVIPFVPDNENSLYVPFMETDREVVRRTQTHNYIEHNTRPVELFTYVAIGSWFNAIGLGFIGFFIALFAQFSFGRYLLTEYPHVFTFGLVSKDGPTREQVEEASFEMLLVGKGYKKKLSSPEEEPLQAPGETVMKLRVKGPDAAYVATSSFLNQSAVTLLQDRNSIPFNGGVLTPGLVFAKTSLIDRLKKHNITFDIV